MGCSSTVDSALSEQGRGGAISNSAPGVIHFKGSLTMEDNYAGVSARYQGITNRRLVQHVLLSGVDLGNNIKNLSQIVI